MKHYLQIVGVVIGFFLIAFLIVDAFGVPILTDPGQWMGHAGVLAGMLGVGLLVADVVLPVPSSLVMMTNGALFGVLGGTLLSLTGSLGAAVLGFGIGRRGGVLLDRFVARDDRARADSLLRRWGATAIIVSRPIPLLAETVAIMAGSSSMGWGRATLAALAGSLPPALLYAMGGAAVVSFQNATLIFGLVLLVAGAFWPIGRLFDPFSSNSLHPGDGGNGSFKSEVAADSGAPR